LALVVLVAHQARRLEREESRAKLIIYLVLVGVKEAREVRP
jgi:hypothetical protein